MGKKELVPPLAKTHPELAEEAEGWDPSNVTAGSHKNLNWKCSLGHSFAASVKSRTAQKSGCPYCSNRRVKIGFNDLATSHPELAKQADGWDPQSVTAGSHKKLSWKCSLGHVWITGVQVRTGKQQSGCPFCSNNKVWPGFNDVAFTNPELIEEADGWDPAHIVSGSSKKLSWKCKLGHKWNASVIERTSAKKSQCPICNWSVLLDGFNDLYTVDKKLASEAHGWNPKEVIANYGGKKEWKCLNNHLWSAPVRIRQQKGYGCPVCTNQVIISGDNDLLTMFPEIAKQAYEWDTTKFGAGHTKKMNWICARGHKWSATVQSRTKSKNGCPYCGKKSILKGFNDLETCNPELAVEAFGWDPGTVISGSAQKLKWKCLFGHVWEATCSMRIHNGTGCPVCSNNKVLKGFNDLKFLHPDIADESDGWDASTVLPGSEAKLNWKCKNDPRHKWEAKVYSRLHGRGCPYCSNQKTQPGINDLATTHPEIARQAIGWDPTNFNAGSDKSMNWQCINFNDHKWKAPIKARAKNSTNCPICSHNKLLTGFNDFATRYPSLAQEAHDWDPSKVITEAGKVLSWQCPNDKTHIWKTSIFSRIRGAECRKCNTWGGFNPQTDGYLYLINHPDWEMLQIGITNNPTQRLKVHEKLGWEILEIRGPMDGYLTRAWETSILKMLKEKGAILGGEDSENVFTGYTEAWLTESFEIESIFELMKLTEEFEEEKSVTNLSHRGTKKD